MATNFPHPSQSPWTNPDNGITYEYDNGVWVPQSGTDGNSGGGGSGDGGGGNIDIGNAVLESKESWNPNNENALIKTFGSVGSQQSGKVLRRDPATGWFYADNTNAGILQISTDEGVTFTDWDKSKNIKELNGGQQFLNMAVDGDRVYCDTLSTNGGMNGSAKCTKIAKWFTSDGGDTWGGGVTNNYGWTQYPKPSFCQFFGDMLIKGSSTSFDSGETFKGGGPSWRFLYYSDITGEYHGTDGTNHIIAEVVDGALVAKNTISSPGGEIVGCWFDKDRNEYVFAAKNKKFYTTNGVDAAVEHGPGTTAFLYAHYVFGVVVAASGSRWYTFYNIDADPQDMGPQPGFSISTTAHWYSSLQWNRDTLCSGCIASTAPSIWKPLKADDRLFYNDRLVLLQGDV